MKMNLDKEMENMSKIFNTHEIMSIKELGYQTIWIIKKHKI